MSIPNGIREESIRTPKASRAGALYSTQLYIYSTSVVALVCGLFVDRNSFIATRRNTRDRGDDLIEISQRHPTIGRLTPTRASRVAA